MNGSPAAVPPSGPPIATQSARLGRWPAQEPDATADAALDPVSRAEEMPRDVRRDFGRPISREHVISALDHDQPGIGQEARETFAHRERADVVSVAPQQQRRDSNTRHLIRQVDTGRRDPPAAPGNACRYSSRHS